MVDSKKFVGLSIGIGSLPYPDTNEAIEKIAKHFSIPFWPQLTRRSFRENMYIQYSEGMPAVVIDEEKKKIYFDTQQDTVSSLEKVYEKFMIDDVGYFAISEQYSAGLYGFTSNSSLVKGHVTGPISFGLTVTDETGKSIFYNEVLFDAIIKVLKMKTRWQIRKLAGEDKQKSVVIFIDEPYLSAFGSAYVSLNRSEVVNYINEIVSSIHQENSIAGIHCCGNTDWSILMDTDVDILNFDAYQYSESMSLYPDKLNQFLVRGGIIAWGIVPSSDKALQETAESLIKKLDSAIQLCANKDISKEKLLDSYMITPSCGLGTLSTELADKILVLIQNTTNLLGEKYGRKS